MASCNLKNPWMSVASYVNLLNETIILAQRIDRKNTNLAVLWPRIDKAFDAFSKCPREYQVTAGSPSSCLYIVTGSVKDPIQQQMHDSNDDFLGRAIGRGIESYATHELEIRDPVSLTRKSGRPYLSYALSSINIHLERGPSIGIIRIIKHLLDAGADPNETWRSETMWGLLLRRLARYSFDPQRGWELTNITAAYELVEAFLEHGAVDVVRLRKGINWHGDRHMEFIKTLDPWKLIDRTFPPVLATDLVKLLNQGAHGTIRVKANRLLASRTPAEQVLATEMIGQRLCNDHRYDRDWD